MTTLALEFSSPRRNIALLRRQAGVAPAEVIGTLSDQGDRSIKPIPLIEQLLATCGTAREQVDAVVVGLGPGSYTGIRSAIALAQGWQLGRGVATRGVSTVEALALQAQELGWFGTVTIVIDAQRNELYLAAYDLTAQERKLVVPLHLVAVDAVKSEPGLAGGILTGPEATKWFPNARLLLPEARALGRLAELSREDVPGEKLEPIYLRAPGFVKAPRRQSHY